MVAVVVVVAAAVVVVVVATVVVVVVVVVLPRRTPWRLAVSDVFSLQQPSQPQQSQQHPICWGGALTERGGVLTLLQQQAQPQRNQQQQL